MRPSYIPPPFTDDSFIWDGYNDKGKKLFINLTYLVTIYLVK